MSMPAIAGGRLLMAFPDSKGDHKHHLACFDLKTGKELWRKPVAGEIITAPVIDDEQVFLGTGYGDVVCLSADQGELLWKASLGQSESIGFQPVVAGGRVYVSTESGSLYSLETGDPQDDGWLMWDANAAHNGIVQTNHRAQQ